MRIITPLCLSLLLIPQFAAASQLVSQLVSHRAEYELTLGISDANANNNVSAIEGKTAYQITNGCDGWEAVEDYLLKFISKTGEDLVVASHFSSWEQHDGALYSFETLEELNFEPELNVSGFAQRTSKTEASASFSLPEDPKNPQNPKTVNMTLPNDVVFPVAHTEEVLRRAQNGETSYFTSMFIGAEPDRALKKTSTFIGKKEQSDALSDMSSALLTKDAWPIQIAYFDANDRSGLPDYELRLLLQDNGVVQSYHVDYGDFILEAKLNDIKPIDVDACQS